MMTDITIARIFDAPPQVVFDNWTRAHEMAGWWAPHDYTVVKSEADARPGGRWSIEFTSPKGTLHVESGEFREIEPPSRLVFTLNETLVTVTFAAHDGGERTEMTFVQTGFPSEAMRDQNAEGWSECFDKLDILLLFDEWLRDAAAKDLDAVMTKIADDVVSYEHNEPLEYVGADAVRQVCRTGFEFQGDNFRWSIPDLRVIVSGDIAVTWGLNHMKSDTYDAWSRGTRIFRKIDGGWKMIHQHVSFPAA
jgi:uncharacterized protein YndB with AHSA1/START domain